jgi:hypothetical protein
MPAGSYRAVATLARLAPSSADASVAEPRSQPGPTLGNVVASESVLVAGVAPSATLDTAAAVGAGRG